MYNNNDSYMKDNYSENWNTPPIARKPKRYAFRPHYDTRHPNYNLGKSRNTKNPFKQVCMMLIT